MDQTVEFTVTQSDSKIMSLSKHNIWYVDYGVTYSWTELKDMMCVCSCMLIIYVNMFYLI